MATLEKLNPDTCAVVAIDCLNTFMKGDGLLSISKFQEMAKGLNQQEVQKDIDKAAQRTGILRQYLFEKKIPQIQFQDAHVVESIHGKRFHSMEIVREGQEPDFLRTFPPHALLEKNRKHGTHDQQAIEEIKLQKSKEVFIHWFASSMPQKARLEPETELIFLKDDFCMSPGSPFIHQLFWELRRQGRFTLIVFGVCDEICNLRNVQLMLASVFNVVYVKDCTFPLDPEKRDVAINYMASFNPLGEGNTGQFFVTTSEELMQLFSS